MNGDDRCPTYAHPHAHELSMYQAPEPRPGERYAMHVADTVASWWFASAVLCLIAAWVVWNPAAKPFEPYPVIIFAVISAALATVASLQGP